MIATSQLERVRIDVADGVSVSALVQVPRNVSSCFVMAHGAGAGMEHPFMSAVSQGLFERQIATFRYQFPFMEAGSKRPDRPALAHAAVRAAVTSASAAFPSKPIVAGGKSFGARMTSQAQAIAPLAGVKGLVFLGFPLHPPGKPSNERAAHLEGIDIPMLFLQGTRDDLAELERIQIVVATLGARAELEVVDGADHSFHVLKRSGRTDDDVIVQLCEGIARASQAYAAKA